MRRFEDSTHKMLVSLSHTIEDELTIGGYYMDDNRSEDKRTLASH